jgi:hypothetical protein
MVSERGGEWAAAEEEAEAEAEAEAGSAANTCCEVLTSRSGEADGADAAARRAAAAAAEVAP